MIRPNQPFRAWGNIDNILGGMPNGNWAYIGCVSPEKRCTALVGSIDPFGQLVNKLIFRIRDKPSDDSEIIQELTDANLGVFLNNGTNLNSIAEIEYNAPFGSFEQIIATFLGSGIAKNLIVDITSLPQKVLFFLIKMLRNPKWEIDNIVVTYAEPIRYDRKALVANHESWDALPGFRLPRGSSEDRRVVIGVGYDPMGLPDQVNASDFNENTISFLFPFPAAPDRVSRNWRFIRRIFPNAEDKKLKIIRVDGLNTPEIFDELCGIGNHGERALSLAPYGPKPVSLAMALYASKYSTGEFQTGVYYTHPHYHNPYYSHGIKMRDGQPILNSYCTRINGVDLY